MPVFNRKIYGFFYSVQRGRLTLLAVYYFQRGYSIRGHHTTKISKDCFENKEHIQKGKYAVKYSRLTGFDALLIDRVVYRFSL